MFITDFKRTIHMHEVHGYIKPSEQHHALEERTPGTETESDQLNQMFKII